MPTHLLGSTVIFIPPFLIGTSIGMMNSAIVPSVLRVLVKTDRSYSIAIISSTMHFSYVLSSIISGIIYEISKLIILNHAYKFMLLFMQLFNYIVFKFIGELARLDNLLGLNIEWWKMFTSNYCWQCSFYQNNT